LTSFQVVLVLRITCLLSVDKYSYVETFGFISVVFLPYFTLGSYLHLCVQVHTSQPLASTSKFGRWTLTEKEWNFRYGTRQDRKDFALSPLRKQQATLSLNAMRWKQVSKTTNEVQLKGVFTALRSHWPN